MRGTSLDEIRPGVDRVVIRIAMKCAVLTLVIGFTIFKLLDA